MSLSKRRAATLAAMSIIAVSLLVGTVYLLVPSDLPISTRTIAAFALGTQDEVQARARALSGSASAMFIEGMKLQFKFLNGSTETIWDFGQSDVNEWPNFSIPECVGELNSTDIVEIHLDRTLTLCIGGDSPIIATLLTSDCTVHSYLMGETTVDLGVLNVTDELMGGVSSQTSQPPFFARGKYLTYPHAINPQWTNTGCWNDYRGFPEDFPPAWQIDSAQIQNILLNASGPAIINFKMDLSVNVDYKSMTDDGNVTSSESGTAQWSGTWGTFQLLHEGDKLIGLTYNFTNIGLDAILT